ncbi:MAG: ATP-binding protein, partial [Candidatus ainarchaeum sp.]|nr:ATP-binding protein [Candidatus ainarchaeum sp.]
MEEDSIYNDDRVEKTIDTEKDIFDDVFGEDDEKKNARKKMREKAMELIGKKENEKKVEEDSNEPELFVDVEEIKNAKKRLETISGKNKNNFNDIVKEGMEKTIENNNKKELSGKLNLNIIHNEGVQEEKKPFEKMSGVEKNIVKSVIKNKAKKSIVKEDDLADYLLKEHGTKEEDIEKTNFGFEKEAEKIVNDNTDNNELKIKPKLDFLINDETGHAFIGRKKSVLKQYGEEAALFVGRVQEEDLHHKQVYLDGLNPHVVFVCGSRGSGKSYVLGVLAEELAIKNKNVGIVVVDPIGVFWSMKHPNKENKELELLADWEIMPKGLENIKVFIPVGMKESVPKSTFDQTFSIQPALLNAEDWCLTFGIDRFSPTGLLMEKGITKVKKGYVTEDGKQIRGKENTFGLEDLINCFNNDSDLNNKEKGYKTDSIRALVSRFDAAKGWGVFDEKGTPLSQLSRAGQMTILDTSFLEDNVSALVIGILARRLLSARKLSTRREAAGKFSETTMEDLIELNVPPTWLFIDEAHTLIPGGNQKTPASSALVEYVKQGRRPGLSLVFATQQPSAIDTRVLSQLDIIITHKLVFDDDIKAIWKRTPTIIPGTYKKPNFIKSLPVGTALTGDRQETTTRAFVMNIRPRMSQHEGRDAETTEVKHELSKDQVEKLAVSIVLKQLEKDPSLSLQSLEETLDTLNNTYKQNVTLALLIDLLKKKGLNVDEEKVYAKGVLEEIEHEKKQELKEEISEEKNLNENIIEEDNDKEKIEKEEEYDEFVELTALKTNIIEKDARLLIAKHRLKKKFGLFGEEEILDRLSLKYCVIYKIQYNYFSQKDAYQIGEAYINS